MLWVTYPTLQLSLCCVLQFLCTPLQDKLKTQEHICVVHFFICSIYPIPSPKKSTVDCGFELELQSKTVSYGGLPFHEASVSISLVLNLPLVTRKPFVYVRLFHVVAVSFSVILLGLLILNVSCC